MRSARGIAAALLIFAGLLHPALSPATDTDGANDCVKTHSDFGDAPEGIPAYVGVLAAFPTCVAAGPIGTQSGPCPPISTPPGQAGYVRHLRSNGDPAYWLGCFAGQSGLDAENDGKVNASGGLNSDCAPAVPVDCFEAAFGLTFGQDECYGSNDAALAAPVSFTACTPAQLTFSVADCGSTDRTVMLNVLVDWNGDGDWNDSFDCAGVCVYEWAVKNAPVHIMGGCVTVTTPFFTAGPQTGNAWMRITISNSAVNDNFPWAGSAGVLGDLRNGETEDYPVTITSSGGGANCPDYEDWGDAPEESPAYAGVPGRFPTCFAAGLPGSQQSACAPISTPPGATGYVRHVATPLTPKFYLGCGDPAAGTFGIDSESNAKMNATGAVASACDPSLGVDCVENAFGLSFGQDECTADLDGDAAVRQAVTLQACQKETVDFYFNNCDPGELGQFYLNVLVDMNQDGDWNDNFDCAGQCAYEWAVKNVPFAAPVGCQLRTTPAFLVGPNAGPSWMRITVTQGPVGDSFPWNGSANAGGPDFFEGGETEDYPITILGPDTCAVGYDDFGDAPEDLPAYSGGVVGHFPTCLAAGAAGTMEFQCGTARSTPPGATGHVLHRTLASDADHFWLGCNNLGGTPLVAVDGEVDGRMNVGAPLGGSSACLPAQLTDCLDFFTGLGINQDECYGDADAGLPSPKFFAACSLGTVAYQAWNCSTHPVTARLNVLVDWNHDGDWNDHLNAVCSPQGCAYEWALKNEIVTLAPGCNSLTTPSFFTGPTAGRAWMRLSLSSDPVGDDFPWNGSAGSPGGVLRGGESEDYVINVVPLSTEVAPGARVERVWLGAPRPNPATRDVVLDYALPVEGEVSLAVFDLAGRRVALVESGVKPAGVHHAGWDFRDFSGRVVPPGQYTLKLRFGDRVLTRSLLRVR